MFSRRRSPQGHISLRSLTPPRQEQAELPCSGRQAKHTFFTTAHGGRSARRDWRDRTSAAVSVYNVADPHLEGALQPFAAQRLYGLYTTVGDFWSFALTLNAKSSNKPPSNYTAFFDKLLIATLSLAAQASLPYPPGSTPTRRP